MALLEHNSSDYRKYAISKEDIKLQKNTLKKLEFEAAACCDGALDHPTKILRSYDDSNIIISNGNGDGAALLFDTTTPLPYVHHIEIGAHEKSKIWRVTLKSELEKVKTGGRYQYVGYCRTCGKKHVRKSFCKSRLCPTCSGKLHRERSAKVVEYLEPYLSRWLEWSLYTFTLPSSLRGKVTKWGDLLSLRRTAIRICKEVVGGVGGLVTVHTFSSKTPADRHIHVHVLLMRRKNHRWKKARNRWGKYLKKRYGYKGPVVVQEERVLRGRMKERVRAAKLRHVVRYMLRLPDPGPKTYHHYRLLMGHQSYAYFGEVMAGFRGGTQSRHKWECDCGGEVNLFCILDTINPENSLWNRFDVDYIIDKWPDEWGGLVQQLQQIEDYRRLRRN